MSPTVRLGLKTASALVGLAAVGLFSGSAKAATFTRTFNGFTDAFQPSAWGKPTAGTTLGGAGTINSGTGTMELTVPDTGGSFYQFTFDTTKLNGTYDGAAAGEENLYKFKSGTATFNWAWSFTDGADIGLAYPFQTVVGSNTATLTTRTPLAPVNLMSSYVTSATGATLAVGSPTTFGFKLSSSGGDLPAGAVATITGFSFEATYAKVPGPLPAAGAVGGFMWSRRLRRRLKLARASA